MILNILIIFTLIVLIIYLKSNERGNFDKHTFKDTDYIVLNEKDKDKAANMLHYLINDIKQLINHLKQKYPNNSHVKLIIKRFNPKNISEGSPDNKDFTYTENKGQNLVICLRDKETLQIHQKNLLLFPLLHELAHQGVYEYSGHGPEFIRVFKFLLDEAEKLGIYKPIDFNNSPTKYCSMTIDSHP